MNASPIVIMTALLAGCAGTPIMGGVGGEGATATGMQCVDWHVTPREEGDRLVWDKVRCKSWKVGPTRVEWAEWFIRQQRRDRLLD